MFWTGWHNGSHHRPYSGYGFKVSAEDRDLYFNREWKFVTLALPVAEGFVLSEANIDKDSFWGDCRELITKDIGLWMMSNKTAPWVKGKPPRFTVWRVNEATFSVYPYESVSGLGGETLFQGQ